MKYFFILGANPTLSLAELAAIFNHDQFSLIQNNIAILEIIHEIEAKSIKKIGGVIKFGLIHNEITSFATQDVLKSVAAFSKPTEAETKFKFGISYYGKSKINQKALAMEFKKLLKQSGLNSRWVVSRELTLSSVVVEQNKLTTEKGVEIVIIQFNKRLLLGKTLAVQPFKDLSFRDYGRPARDDSSGLLPPKLAQIMINLSGANLNKTVLDPFCGSGTIITEAILMGYQKVIGTDISEKAISDTKTNVAWIQSKFQISPPSPSEARQANFKFKIFNSDARQISKHIQPNSVDAIITEPYLGPQHGQFDINKTVSVLEQLYGKSLLEFKKILKPGGKIVMVWPSFCGQFKNIFLNPNLAGLKIVNPIPLALQKNIFVKLTDRQTIIYGRERQKVWREIVVLENKKR